MGIFRKILASGSAVALLCAVLLGAGSLGNSVAGASTSRSGLVASVDHLRGHRVVGFGATVGAIGPKGFVARFDGRSEFVAVRSFTRFRFADGQRTSYSELGTGESVHVLGVRYPRSVVALVVRIESFKRIEFRGTVTSLGTGSFTVLRNHQSVTVDVSTSTHYRERGVPNVTFADVAVGDIVNIVAFKTGNAGTVAAVAVAIEPFPSLEIIGYVTSVAATSFTILHAHQSFTVDVSDLTTYHERGHVTTSYSNVAVGEHVAIFGTKTAIAGTVAALRVDIGTFPLAFFSGKVTSIGTESFMVQRGAVSISVDVSGETTYREQGVGKATFSDLRVGDVVHVFATKTAAPRTVEALHVVIGTFSYVERDGSILSIGTTSFTVLFDHQSFTIDVSPQTVYDDP